MQKLPTQRQIKRGNERERGRGSTLSRTICKLCAKAFAVGVRLRDHHAVTATLLIDAARAVPKRELYADRSSVGDGKININR